MTEHIVVAFRMPRAGMRRGQPTYIVRARSMRARAEALGARLVAWGSGVLAVSWDLDSIDEAILLATSSREDAPSPDRMWACGIAEGELEPLAPEDARLHLSWGPSLVVALALARAAHAGEIVVSEDVRVVRAGRLDLVGARSGIDEGRRHRGWRLRAEHPWRRMRRSDSRALAGPDVGDGPLTTDGGTSDDFLGFTEAAAPRSASEGGAGATRVASLVHEIARAGSPADALAALPAARQARKDAESASAEVRCKAALALAVALSVAGLTDEAMREALGALALARETRSERAIAACFALLSKIYAGAGWRDAASRLRDFALHGPGAPRQEGSDGGAK